MTRSWNTGTSVFGTFPTAYDHFAEGEAPEPPYLIFRLSGSHNFFADARVYRKILRLNLELYTDRKDPEAETKVEDVLDAHGIIYDKHEIWIGPERLYEVLYEMEVIDDGYEQDQIWP